MLPCAMSVSCRLLKSVTFPGREWSLLRFVCACLCCTSCPQVVELRGAICVLLTKKFDFQQIAQLVGSVQGEFVMNLLVCVDYFARIKTGKQRGRMATPPKWKEGSM